MTPNLGLLVSHYRQIIVGSFQKPETPIVASDVAFNTGALTPFHNKNVDIFYFCCWKHCFTYY
jgi:hypothetical protein